MFWGFDANISDVTTAAFCVRGLLRPKGPENIDNMYGVTYTVPIQSMA